MSHPKVHPGLDLESAKPPLHYLLWYLGDGSPSSDAQRRLKRASTFVSRSRRTPSRMSFGPCRATFDCFEVPRLAAGSPQPPYSWMILLTPTRQPRDPPEPRYPRGRPGSPLSDLAVVAYSHLDDRIRKSWCGRRATCPSVSRGFPRCTDPVSRISAFVAATPTSSPRAACRSAGPRCRARRCSAHLAAIRAQLGAL